MNKAPSAVAEPRATTNINCFGVPFTKEQFAILNGQDPLLAMNLDDAIASGDPRFVFRQRNTKEGRDIKGIYNRLCLKYHPDRYKPELADQVPNPISMTLQGEIFKAIDAAFKQVTTDYKSYVYKEAPSYKTPAKSRGAPSTPRRTPARR